MLAGAVLAALALGTSACGGAADEQSDLTETRAGADLLTDITADTAEAFSCEALVDYDGIYLGDNSKVTEFMRAMPTGGSMDTFEILGDEGKLRVVYAVPDTFPEVEPLNATLQAMADCAREYVTNLETVEFAIPDMQGDGLVYEK